MRNLKTDTFIQVAGTEDTKFKVTKDIIDQIPHNDCDAAIIGDVNQEIFEYFIDQCGDRYKAIWLWQSPRVNDLTPFEKLKNIEEISITWNQKAEKLWDFSKNEKLWSFHYADFKRVHDLSPLAGSKSIKELYIFGDVHTKYVIDSIEPLGQMDNLEYLHLAPGGVNDNKIAPLSKIKKLNHLGLALSIFSFEKMAWLRARISNDITEEMLGPYWDYSDWEVMISGKRKPTLHKREHADRIEKYVKKFKELVQYYKDNPEEDEPEK